MVVTGDAPAAAAVATVGAKLLLVSDIVTGVAVDATPLAIVTTEYTPGAIPSGSVTVAVSVTALATLVLLQLETVPKEVGPCGDVTAIVGVGLPVSVFDGTVINGFSELASASGPGHGEG